MNFLNKIEDNSLLLTSNDIKNKIVDYIEENNLLINVKFISFEELKRGLMFDYTNEAINFVMNDKKVSYEVAEYYIDNT